MTMYVIGPLPLTDQEIEASKGQQKRGLDTGFLVFTFQFTSLSLTTSWNLDKLLILHL